MFSFDGVMYEGCRFGAGGVGQVASGLVSTNDEWRIDWVARREQDRKRRKYSVLQPFSAVAVAVEFRGFADLNRPCSGKCYVREGVNHLQNCGKYRGMSQLHPVSCGFGRSSFKGFTITSVRAPNTYLFD